MNQIFTKKPLSVLMALVMLLTMLSLSVTAAASEVDTSDATSFVFADSGVTVTQGAYTGFKVNGTALSITAAGTYVVSGSCSNGSITVKKNVTGVTLVLSGLTLSASATAPITCNKGSGVSIIAAAGTLNALADDCYNNDDVYTDETLYPNIENAVIKCKDGSNVTIGGTGAINVTANGKNGVKGGGDLYEEDADGNATDTLLSSASLTIENVTLNIICNANDGLKSDKELNLLSGTVTVSAVDDGIKCDRVLNIGAAGTDGPTVTVTKAAEGIEAATVNVYSGQISVTASDDGVNAANSDIAERSAEFSYNQYGGSVLINAANGDGIDSNGSATLSGGTLEIFAPSQGDGDPIDTEYGCAFSGATVLAVGHAMMAQSYRGTYAAFGGGNGGRPGFGGGMGGSQTNLVKAGDTITITDASGQTLYTSRSKAVRNASYVLFASPELKEGGSYRLNGSAAASAVTGTGGMNPGGPGGQPEQPGQPGGTAGETGVFSTLIRMFNWLRNLFSRAVTFFKSFI